MVLVKKFEKTKELGESQGNVVSCQERKHLLQEKRSGQQPRTPQKVQQNMDKEISVGSGSIK